MKVLHSLKRVIISIAAFIALWQLLCSISGFHPNLLPPPLAVGKALGEVFTDGAIFSDIKDSMYRFVSGYFLAVLAAIPLGLVLGWFKRVFAYINPLIQLLRPISPMAWMPFIVLFFGIGDIPAIAIIFIAAFFPVLLSTAAAVGNVDRTYLKVAANFGIRQPAVLYKIVFPSAFPQIANGLHLALGTAWVFLVAGEMIGIQSGLGFLIIDARNNIRTDLLLATIFIIGTIGFLLDALIKEIEKWVFNRWGQERG